MEVSTVLEQFYPSTERALFVNRQAELARLAYCRDRLQEGRPQAANLALFGLRRIGKTMLLKEFMAHTLETCPQVVPVYLDLEHACSAPEAFALGLIGAVCYWFGRRGEGSPRRFLAFDTLLLEAAALPANTIREHLEILQREWRAATRNRPFLLDLALGFAEELAAETGLYFILVLDEFQAIETLTHYRETRNALALVRTSLQRQARVAYFLAGSAISVMTRLVSDAQSPLFVQLDKLPLTYLGHDDVAELAAKLSPDLDAPDVVARINRLTQGHPFYVTRVCERIVQLHRLQNLPLDVETVNLAFLAEVLSPQGHIYDFCKYIYELSLQRARGYGSLQAILEVLSDEPVLSAAELARRLRVSYSTIRGYLRWLLEVDLVMETEGGYTFRDPVLRYWVAQATRGIEVDSFPRRQDVWDLVSHLDEQFQRSSTELGRAKESQIGELLRRFAGQRVSGALFGRSEEVTLPAFVTVAPYCSPDGQIEVDVLAEGDERWAVEVKWRGKVAGEKELTALLQKARTLDARPWFISRDGFTPAAQAYAAAHDILISSRADVEELEQYLV